MQSVYNKCKSFLDKRQEAFLLIEVSIAIALMGIFLLIITQHEAQLISAVRYAKHVQELLHHTEAALHTHTSTMHYDSIITDAYTITYAIKPIEYTVPIIAAPFGSKVVAVTGRSKWYNYTVTLMTVL